MIQEVRHYVLEDADSLSIKARDFDRKNRTIALGTCAPAPLWTVSPLIANLYPHMSLQTEMNNEKSLLTGLENQVYQLIVLHEKPADDAYFYKECGKESLMFALPKGHRYARRKTLAFAEMNGENMLLMPDIGFWAFVLEKMPDSRFLTQNDRFSFNELIEASSLPAFVSNLSEKFSKVPEGRIYVPIADEAATVTYYLVCKNERKKEFQALFRAL